MNTRSDGAPGGGDDLTATEESREPGVAEDSDLARLLAVESRLEASLAEERRRADATVEAAREQARAVRRDEAARLEEELVEMRARVRDEHRDAVEEIRRRADRRARRYRETTDERVEQLARAVAERLVEDPP